MGDGDVRADGGARLDGGSADGDGGTTAGRPDAGACAAPDDADCELCNGVDDDGDGATDEAPALAACAASGAVMACLAGECVVAECEAGRRDCDGRAENGCEVTLGSAASCGGCGEDCGQGAAVAAARCTEALSCEVTACEPGYVDCDADADNGCEASFSDVLNCGGCASTGDAQPCTGLDNTLASSCESERCAVTRCVPGFADCNGDSADGCEHDTAAQGCCPGEPDSDGDGTFDCLDGCPADATKVDPGECGCGVSDVDADTDGIADCRTDCWGLPSNFDPFDGALAFTADAQLSCSPTLDSGAPPESMISGWCNGEAPLPVVRDQPGGGSQVVILPLRGLTLAAGERLRLTGPLPVLIAVQGDVQIAGHLDAGSAGDTAAGAGAGVGCASQQRGAAGGNASNDGAAGGGGGGFGSAGGGGGRSDDGNGGGGRGGHDGSGGGRSDDGDGGGGGAVASDLSLVPLRGGCGGGRGGHDGSGGGPGGFGGGALQLSVTGALRVTDTGVISASGGAGQTGGRSRAGGGGGGSGGGLLLEANLIELAPGAWVTANGGSGAGGAHASGTCAGDGRDGGTMRSTPTPGGAGCSGSGSGGSGGAAGGGATPGQSTSGNDAAGGGGGGRGVVVMQPLAASLCAQ